MCYGERYCYYCFKFNLCYSNLATLFVVIMKSNVFNIVHDNLYKKITWKYGGKNNENV